MADAPQAVQKEQRQKDDAAQAGRSPAAHDELSRRQADREACQHRAATSRRRPTPDASHDSSRPRSSSLRMAPVAAIKAQKPTITGMKL